jgi:hypothetical protein
LRETNTQCPLNTSVLIGSIMAWTRNGIACTASTACNTRPLNSPEEHWAAGYQDVGRAISHPEVTQLSGQDGGRSHLRLGPLQAEMTSAAHIAPIAVRYR